MSSDPESLEKSKCVRCGKDSKNGGKGGRCSSCLDKLKSAKKKPGSAQRAQTKFDDSKRRENGKNGTASYKSKGRVKDRKSFVKRFQNDEKKKGEKLSPNRLDNKRGYAADNVDNIKESLNVGRHDVDPKKLSAWKKRLKKTGVSMEEFAVLLKAKFASPAEQKANKAKATTSANKDAMSAMNSSKSSPNQKDTFKHVVESTSPSMHAVQAANYAPGTPANLAHAALAYHHSGVKPLSEIEVHKHKKMLTDHYNS